VSDVEVSESCYMVVGSKTWNRRIFDETISQFPGHWHYIDRQQELTPDRIRALDPKRIFFLHWSWKLPEEIVEKYECVCFHMTDVPYGRGGSPLQNLIVRGHQETKLTALKMTAQFDAGPVYCKERLLLYGAAEEIYIRMTVLAATMILKINEENLQPVSQVGKPTVFKRRKREESQLSSLPDLSALYDFIRMLDADGYPPAFVEHDGFCYEFSRAVLYEGHIKADVIIRPVKGESV